MNLAEWLAMALVLTALGALSVILTCYAILFDLPPHVAGKFRSPRKLGLRRGGETHT